MGNVENWTMEREKKKGFVRAREERRRGWTQAGVEVLYTAAARRWLRFPCLFLFRCISRSAGKIERKKKEKKKKEEEIKENKWIREKGRNWPKIEGKGLTGRICGGKEKDEDETREKKKKRREWRYEVKQEMKIKRRKKRKKDEMRNKMWERENESKSNKFIFDTLLGRSKWIFLFQFFC